MNIYNLPYDKMIERWTDVVLYASKSSDSFSLITEQLKPYQAEPPKCRHDELLDPISGDLLQQEVNVKSWPGTKTSDKHRVLNLYRMSKTTRAWLKTCPNLLDCSRDLPQGHMLLPKRKAMAVCDNTREGANAPESDRGGQSVLCFAGKKLTHGQIEV